MYRDRRIDRNNLIYLLAGISASGDDGNTADLEDCIRSAISMSLRENVMASTPNLHFMATVGGCRICRGS